LYHNFEWLPTDPPRPAPALMTACEAAEYLRLTEEGRDIGDAMASLEYLVASGRIRPCRVGRHNRYLRQELDRFMHEQTEQYSARYQSPPNRNTNGRVPTPEEPTP
jgi:hypothetical protein